LLIDITKTEQKDQLIWESKTGEINKNDVFKINEKD